MAAFWDTVKDPLFQFGHSYPKVSTVVVMLLAGFVWWVIFVKTPRVQAPPSTAPINQSVGNVSGGTVNQAGGNITIINPGVSEEVIRQLINQKDSTDYARLSAEYSMGYVILGVAGRKIVYLSDHAPEGLRVDWNRVDIKLDKAAGTVDVQLPDFVYGDRNEMTGCSVKLPYLTGKKAGFGLGPYRAYLEVLDAVSGVFVVGIKKLP